MSRNQSRVKPPKGKNQKSVQPESPVQQQMQPLEVASPFNFIVPTEVVDLPSKGQYYPEGHALYNADSIEIKHMTAKEEDILTSTTLLKKGVALDKMLQSIIVDKRIKVEDLLIGDKNALLVASRVFGYGADYSTQVTCPSCDSTYVTDFNLNELKNKELLEIEAVEKTVNNTFIVPLPKSNFVIEFRLLTSRDESAMSSNKASGSMKLLKLITISVNEQTDRFYIERALQSLPILDVSILKKAYAAVMPDINMFQDVECVECGETTEMGVPLSAEFFWPNF